MTSDDDGRDGRFLQRWSRRKLDREPADPGEVMPADEASLKGETPEESEEHRLLLQQNREEAEAIDLASLNARSDLSPFFKAGVPKALKSAAMRAVWRSDPVFANLDGLNDYEENFADPDLIRKFAGTAWKIGRGYLGDDDEAEQTVAAADEPRDTLDEPDEPEEIGDEDAAAAGDEAEMNEVLAGTGEEVVPDTGIPEEEERPRVPLRTRLALDDWQTD